MGYVLCSSAGRGTANRVAVVGLLLCVSSTASAAVVARVFLPDGETPLDIADPNVPCVYRDIMVGTKLAIIINSELAEDWNGRLRIEGPDRRGIISTRDFNDVTPTRKGSVFEASGENAWVRRVETYSQAGVTMTAMTSVMAGDWFIFDYVATNVGTCRVEFSKVIVQPVENFDPLNPPETEEISLQELVFSHVPTRDFNGDTKVDLVDFAIMAAFHGFTDCAALNACGGADLDLDGAVESDDWMLFAAYWLEHTQ